MKEIWTWLGTLNWGNVPAWFGSTLSSVSVFLVIMVLRRDRRRERSKQADGLVVWVTHTVSLSKEVPHVATVHVINTSEAPIPTAWLKIVEGASTTSWGLRNPAKNSEQVILGKESFEMSIRTVELIVSNASQMELHMIDALHQKWKRDLRSNKVSKLSDWNMPSGIF